MSRLSRKLLALFVALLMALAPLQGVMAGMGSFSSGNQDRCDMSQMDGTAAMDMTSSASMVHYHCDHCNHDDACCTGHNCLSGHCASAMMALLPVVASLFSQRVSVQLPQIGDDLPGTLPTSLFRPPRV